MALSKLAKFRSKIRDLNIHKFLVYSNDAHASEYVCPADERRKYISGFNGSAGTVMIDESNAYLWTDGRYFTQAEQELSEEWTLMRSGEPDVPEPAGLIVDEHKSANENVMIGVDSSFITASDAIKLQDSFKIANESILLKPIDMSENPVDLVWEEESGEDAATSGKPSYPTGFIDVHPIEFAGQSHQSKIISLQTKIAEANAVATVITKLDEVAWLLNIRGRDVPCNPVSICYAVVTLNQAHLFINPIKLGSHESECKKHLLSADIQIHSYSDIDGFLSNIVDRCIVEHERVLIDITQINWKLYNILNRKNDHGHIVIKNHPSLVALPKAIKNAAEIEGAKQAHIRDGAALTAFFCWLESYYCNIGNRVETGENHPLLLTEYDICQKLEQFRKKVAYHCYPSFDTIAGYGENGAVIHYRPTLEKCKTVGVASMLLIDSGAQYLDGTTDVTRNICLGNSLDVANGIDENLNDDTCDEDHLKTCYTNVLKGHISLARLRFPEGTMGSYIDVLARTHLWNMGLDYGHGTGHGVGSYLNVHEGPQGIGFRKRVNEAGFVPGMITSIEPGYYEVNNFGIRIENLYITVEATSNNNYLPTFHHSNSGRMAKQKPFCAFEPLTMVPIKTRRMLDLSKLTIEEVEWINAYHSIVRSNLLGVMEEVFPEAVDYLMKETEHVYL